MRFVRTTILAGAAAMLVAGTAAVAADGLNTMEVALPDGSTAHIEYAGDRAPRVTVEPAPSQTSFAYDPFLGLERIAYEMRARQQAMLRQMAALRQAAAEAGAAMPGGVILVGNLPAGAHVSYYSSTTDASGCTRTVQYSSDGSGTEPTITRASAGSCDGASASEPGPIPVAAPEPAPRRLDEHDV